MMQRWQQETMRDQPYHDVGAVANGVALEDKRQSVSSARDNSSLQHLGHGDDSVSMADLGRLA
jgi:hypothetical protein